MLSLGRRRFWISMRHDSLVDILSWRYARLGYTSETSSSRELFKRILYKAGDHYERKSLRAGSKISDQMDFWFSPDKSRSEPESEDLKSRITKIEDHCLHDLIQQLRFARFHPLSRDEESYSLNAKYRFSTAVSINWKCFDPFMSRESILQNIVDSKDSNRTYMPNYADRVLFFHRGIGLHRYRGFFFTEKINEIIRRGTTSCALTLRKVAQRKAFQAQQRSKEVYYLLSSGFEKFLGSYLRRVNPEGQAAEVSLSEIEFAQPEITASNTLDSSNNSSQEPNAHKETPERTVSMQPVHIERDEVLQAALTSRQSIDSLPITLYNFFFRVTLQEPTFKEVVVIYRKKYEDPAAPTLAPKTSNSYCDSSTTEKRFQQHNAPGNKRNIYVKIFRDVPMADLELMLPFQSVSFNSSDKINMSLAGLFMMGTFLPVLEFSFSSLSASKAWLLAVFASLSYTTRVISRYYTSWAYYSTLTASVLGDQLQAQGPPAAFWISASAAHQIRKEMAIVYLALCELYHAEEMIQTRANSTIESNSVEDINTTKLHSLEDISARATKILHQSCDESLYFDPKNALEELVDGELVHRHGDQYKAILPWELNLEQRCV